MPDFWGVTVVMILVLCGIASNWWDTRKVIRRVGAKLLTTAIWAHVIAAGFAAVSGVVVALYITLLGLQETVTLAACDLAVKYWGGFVIAWFIAASFVGLWLAIRAERHLKRSSVPIQQDSTTEMTDSYTPHKGGEDEDKPTAWRRVRK